MTSKLNYSLFYGHKNITIILISGYANINSLIHVMQVIIFNPISIRYAEIYVIREHFQNLYNKIYMKYHNIRVIYTFLHYQIQNIKKFGRFVKCYALC